MKRILLMIAVVACTILAKADIADTLALSDVTVTGIKQGTVHNSAPAAITVATRPTLERNGVTGTKTGSALVPNLFIPDYGSRMTSTIYLRGIGARIDQPAVGLNVDNVAVMCKENYDMDIMDLSRMEVLRGPQSAMYGRNTMGGVINLYTLSPLAYTGTRLLMEAASHGAWRIGASRYERLSPSLGMSISAMYGGTSGEWRNEYNGRRTDHERQGSLRTKVEWNPGNGWFVGNVLSLNYNNEGGYPYQNIATGQIATNDTCFYHRTSVMDGITVKKDMGSWSLSGIASYQFIDDNMTLDQDFTPVPYFTLTQARTEHTGTLDLVAGSKSKGKYRWLAGFNGFYRRYDMDAPVTFLDTGIDQLIESHRNSAVPEYPIQWDTRDFVLGSNFTSPTWGTALYHRSTLTLGRFTVDASLRLDYEHATLKYRSTTHTGYNIMEKSSGTVYAHENIDIDNSGSMSKDFLELLPSLTVSYKLDGTLGTVYANVSRGSKAGGFNTQMFSDVLQQQLMGMMGIGSNYDVDKVVGYRPEKAWNAEVGTHLKPCASINLDLAAFYIDCRDRQLTVFPDGTTTGRLMTNAGKTRNYGIEASLAWRPLASTGVSVSYGYTNAKFTEYNDGHNDYDGCYIPYSPTHTLYGQAYHRIGINGCGEWLEGITLDANLRAAGRIYWNESNTQSQAFYGLLGAGVTLEGRHYSLQLWGRNLTDTAYNTFYFVSIGHEFLQRGHGRSLGATLRMHF